MTALTHELETLWRKHYGTMFRAVLGRRPVQKFVFHEQRYQVGDTVTLSSGPDCGPDSLTGPVEIVSIGSPVVCEKNAHGRVTRRAMIVRTLTSDWLNIGVSLKVGRDIGVSLWSDDVPARRLQRALLDELARI